MAVNISWSAIAPSVNAWSPELITDEYHNYVQDRSNWYSRVRYSIGQIAGTRNLAIRAILEGHKASGWQAQNCGGVPRVRLSGDSSWIDGSYQGRSINTANWTTIGTQYATVTGPAARSIFDAGLAAIDTFVQLTSPITGPTDFAKIAGAWAQGDETLAKSSGSWIPVDELKAKDTGAWATS